MLHFLFPTSTTQRLMVEYSSKESYIAERYQYLERCGSLLRIGRRELASQPLGRPVNATTDSVCHLFLSLGYFRWAKSLSCQFTFASIQYRLRKPRPVKELVSRRSVWIPPASPPRYLGNALEKACYDLGSLAMFSSRSCEISHDNVQPKAISLSSPDHVTGRPFVSMYTCAARAKFLSVYEQLSWVASFTRS